MREATKKLFTEIKDFEVTQKDLNDAIIQHVDELYRDIDKNNGWDIKNLPNISRNLNHLHPYLKERWNLLKKEYEEKNKTKKLILTCTYRSTEQQNKYFQIGRTIELAKNPVTNCDGKKKLSMHNYLPSLAFDCAIVLHNKCIWTAEDYLPIGEIAEKLGLRWGGRWKNPVDVFHIQMIAAGV